VPLHIYLSTSGWLVVYLTADQEPIMMVNWNENASLSENLLKVTLKDAVTKLQNSYTNSEIKYYDFSHPEAVQMSLIRENVTSTNPSNDFTILVPGTVSYAGYTLASFGGGLNSYTDYADLLFNDTYASTITNRAFVYGKYPNFTANTSHTIKLLIRDFDPPASAITLILYNPNSN